MKVKHWLKVLVVTLFLLFLWNERFSISAPAVQSPATGSAIVKSSAKDRRAIQLTVYNSNRALVHEIRRLDLPAGRVSLWFQDVPSSIMPQTVSVRRLGSGRFEVLEQNYEYDLLSPKKILEKYLNRDVVLVRRVLKNQTTAETRIRAHLLSTNGGTVWRIGDRIVVNPTYDYLEFPDLPPNLFARPTLVWLLKTGGGPVTIEASYLTTRMNWHADYIFTLDTKGDRGEMIGWVTIDNQSGATYRNARLKLIAGEVHTVQPERRPVPLQALKERPVPPSPFAEKAFFEYHLYTLQRPTTIHDRQQKQIELFHARGVRAEKQYILRGRSWYYRQRLGEPQTQRVEVAVRLANTQANGLGMPLPAGIVRVYKRDTDGSSQFIGEDRLNHTPKDETFFLTMGKAFDIVAERRQTDFRIAGRCTYEMAYEIKLRNHKDDRVTIRVIEPLGGEWTILHRSHEYRKLDAFTVVFPVTVGPDGEETLTYRVQVRYC